MTDLEKRLQDCDIDAFHTLLHLYGDERRGHYANEDYTPMFPEAEVEEL